MKKFYPLLLFIPMVMMWTSPALAQCGLQVKIEPIPSSTICLGETVDLLAKTNLVAPVPTVCAINPDRTCGLGADSLAVQVGAGTLVNNYGQNPPELFGDFGEAQSRSQLIYLASELRAKGFRGGKITSIGFDIAKTDVGRNANIASFAIKIGCTGASNFSSSFISGLDEVFTPKSITITNGVNTFMFDHGFDWDGINNIVVEICIYTPSGTVFSAANWGSFTRDTVPGFTCWRQSTNPTSSGSCSFTGTEKNYNQRPNTRFGICSPKNINLVYSWGPNNGTLSSLSSNRPTAVPVTNTQYSVTVSRADNPSCKDTDTVDITVVDPGNFALSSNAPLCSNSTLRLYANTTGISFSWSGPNGFVSFDKDPVIPNATSAATGIYTLLVDKGACKTTKTITVTVHPVPNTGIPRDTIICRSAASLDLFSLLTDENSGGTWTDNNTSGILTGSTINPSLLNNAALPKTFRYTYQISNICGTISSSVNVSVAATKSAGLPDDTLICESSAPISLFSILDGSPVTGGFWADNNNTGQSTPGGIFNPASLGGGIYTFTYTVTGSAPCANATALVTVNISNQPKAGNNSNGEVCVNMTANLFPLLANNPDPGGTWSDMDNSGGVLVAATGSLNTASITPGTYRFKYKINAVAPCKADSAILTLKVNGVPKINNHLAICTADKATFSVRFEITGGDPSTYSVSPSGTIGGTDPKIYTSPAFTDGSQVVITVTDGKACGSNSITVKKRCSCPTEAGTMKVNNPLKVCNNAIAVAEYNGGFVNDDDDTLAFVLHSGAGNSLGTVYAMKSAPSFGYVAGIVYGGTYYISAVAGNKRADNLVDLTDDCLDVSAGVPIVFGMVDQPVISFSQNPVCPGDNLTMTGSAAGSPNFFWTGPNGFSSPLPVAAISNITESGNGTYTLTAEAYGCKASTTANLVVTPKPAITITSDAVICQGSGGMVHINVGASKPVEITLGTSTGSMQQLTLVPGMNNISVNPVNTTTYSLLAVSYPGGCNYTLTGSTTMQVINAPKLSYSVPGDSAFCFNESKLGKLVFDFENNLSLDIYYRFNNIPQSLTGISNGTLLTLNASQPGENIFRIDSVAITNGNCTFLDVFRPVVFYNLIDPAVTASISSNQVCTDDSVALSLDVTASAPVKIQYTVNTDLKSIIITKDTVVNVPVAQNSLLNLTGISYVVKPLCSNILSQGFAISTKPLPVFIPEAIPATCNNTNTGQIVVTSAEPGSLYSLNGSAFSASNTFNNLLSGSYTLLVQGTNGCVSRQVIEVLSISNLLVETDVSQTSCGENNGEVAVKVISGIAPFTILFNGEDKTGKPINNLSPGTYRLFIKDSNNCLAQSTITIEPSSKIAFTIADNGIIDCEQPDLGQILINATGGSGKYEYKISGTGFGPDSVFKGLFPQQYLVTVKDDRGCESTMPVLLKAKQKFAIGLNVRKQLLCYESTDGQILVSATGADPLLTYSKNGVDYLPDPLIANIGPGSVTIYVRELAGCRREQTVSFAMTRPQPIDLELLSSHEPRCPDVEDGFILMEATGGALNEKQYSVDGGETFRNTPVFVNLPKGDYVLVAKNAYNCLSETLTLSFTGPEEIVINTSFSFNEEKDLATLVINATGGSGTYFYSLDDINYSTDNSFNNLEPGTYTIHIKDANGCTASGNVVISAVGITTLDPESIAVFPNPLGEVLRIVPGEPLSEVAIDISDGMGKIVHSEKIDLVNSAGISIKLPENMAYGVYNLKLGSKQGTLNKKLLKL